MNRRIKKKIEKRKQKEFALTFDRWAEKASQMLHILQPVEESVNFRDLADLFDDLVYSRGHEILPGSMQFPPRGMKILRNRVKCRICNTVIESTSSNSLVWCNCKETGIGGGRLYLKRLSTDPEDYDELTEFLPKNKRKRNHDARR